MSIVIPFLAFLLVGAIAAYHRLRLPVWAALTATALVACWLLGASGTATLIAGLVSALIALPLLVFKKVPSGFVPAQDKQYLVAFAQLPEGASLERTDSVIRRMGDIMLKHPGVSDSIAFPGLSINGFTNSPNSGIAFVNLKAFEVRKGPGMSGTQIAAQLNKEFS
mgnify:CR=1 FL=1